MLFIIPNLVASFKKELFYPLKSDNIIVLFILWKGMVIMMSNYKSFSELKRLARVQLQGKYGTLIGALLIQELLVFFASGLPAALLPGTDTLSNTLYYIVVFYHSAYCRGSTGRSQLHVSESRLWYGVWYRRYLLLLQT